MCWCTPNLRTPFCGKQECHPFGEPNIDWSEFKIPPEFFEKSEEAVKMPEEEDTTTTQQCLVDQVLDIMNMQLEIINSLCIPVIVSGNYDVEEK